MFSGPLLPALWRHRIAPARPWLGASGVARRAFSGSRPAHMVAMCVAVAYQI